MTRSENEAVPSIRGRAVRSKRVCIPVGGASSEALVLGKLRLHMQLGARGLADESGTGISHLESTFFPKGCMAL